MNAPIPEIIKSIFSKKRVDLYKYINSTSSPVMFELEGKTYIITSKFPRHLIKNIGS